jgi:hypothetical protein
MGRLPFLFLIRKGRGDTQLNFLRGMNLWEIFGVGNNEPENGQYI